MSKAYTDSFAGQVGRPIAEAARTSTEPLFFSVSAASPTWRLKAPAASLTFPAASSATPSFSSSLFLNHVGAEPGLREPRLPPLFFVISGFVITHVARTDTRATFLLKRFFRIYPPLVVAVLIALGVLLVGGWLGLPGYNVAPFTLNDILLCMAALDVLVPVPVLAVGWTLTVEVCFYLNAALFFAMALTLHDAKLPRVVRWVGDISYSLYLIHLPVGVIVANVVYPRAGIALTIGLSVAASLATATLMHLWVERPSQRLARRLQVLLP